MTFLASGASVEPGVIVSIMWIAVAALLSPLLSFLTGKRVPGVVFMLVLGVLIGPEVLDLAHSDGSNALLRELGLGMLFLLAGWEIDPDTMRGRQMKHASGVWLLSLMLAFAGSLVVFGTDDMLRSVVMAIAVSSTAMGTLLPVIKTAGVSDSPVGRGVLVHGAVGELGPVFAMALLLSSRATWPTLAFLLIFMGGALVVAFVPRTVSRLVPWVGRAVRDGASHTSQTVMRAVIVLLTLLMALASVFELDVVLGAFAAGIILRGLVPARARKTVEARLDVMGYGLLIPVFFVTSGMSIHLDDVKDAPWLVVMGVVVILMARGLPIFLAERFTDTGSGITGVRDQLQMSLYSATGLPIIVAVTDVAEARGLIDEALASILVCSGAATVLLFPMLAHLAGQYLPGPVEAEDSPEAKAHREHAAKQEHAEYKEQKTQAAAKAGQQAHPSNKATAVETQEKKRPKSTTGADSEVTLDDDHPSTK
ncbi:sodium:proton antiporter [Corynebacterium sp. 13CS0277]|uniref:cation:proton antiporter n=1 Tax=Corynebacterium sp. 13CS0277 TaxID=2071994 RepID=UPI000D03805C|nr:cation:proton antiporter [Corynebacterium sp. 13CS0277]PRQ11009.1 sodium:proton antiporter [Corynebacterium sp. 13CS0277]